MSNNRRLGIALALLAIIVLLGACGAGQGRLVLIDTTGIFDRSRLAAAAQPLLDRGVALVVISVDRGDDRGDDFTRQLDTLSLRRGDAIAPEAIALYVSFEPRYSELRAGSRWSPSLPNDVLRTIRLETLNPALRAGDATGGVAAALAALEQHLAAPAGRPWWQVAGIVLYCGLVIVPFLIGFGPFLGRFVWDELGLGVPAGWLGRAVARSAPARLIVWLWERSPPGRALARDRQREAMRSARYALNWRAKSAHEDVKLWMDRCRPESSAGVWTRLQMLDERRAELELHSPDDPGLPAQLRRLGDDYTQCEHLAREMSSLEREASSPRRKIEEALATGGYVPPPPRGGKRSGNTPPPSRGGKRKRKDAKANPLALATPEALAKLGDRLAELERRHAALLARLPDGDHSELMQLITRLQNAYNQLAHDAYAPWAALFPDRAEAAGREADAILKRYIRSAQDSSSGGYSVSPGPSIASTSTSDTFTSSDSSSAGSDSSSGPSSDGGSW